MCHYDEDMNVVGQFEISMERGMSPITRWDLLHDNVYYNAINKTIVLCPSLGIDHKHVCMYVCMYMPFMTYVHFVIHFQVATANVGMHHSSNIFYWKRTIIL